MAGTEFADFRSGKTAAQESVKAAGKSISTFQERKKPNFKLIHLVSRVMPAGGGKKKVKTKRKADIPPKDTRSGMLVTTDRVPQETVTRSRQRPFKSSSNVISTGFADRLAERKKSERIRIFRQFGILAITVFLLLILIWTLLFSPLFAYDPKKTSISGSGKVVDKAAVNALLNTYQGTSLLRISTGSLETEIAKTNNWIKEVQVKRRFLHGLDIRITLRKPVAIYQQNQLLSDDAKILDGKNMAAGLPQIDSHCAANRNQNCLEFAVSIIKMLPSDLAKNLQNIEIAPSGSLNLKFANEKLVIWGTDEHRSEKLKILKIIFKEPGHTYNLSDYSAPSVK